MSSNTYPVTEIYGSSPTSIDDAIRNAVRTAGKSIRNMEYSAITEIRGYSGRRRRPERAEKYSPV